MENKKFSKAYKEVFELLKFFPKKDLDKIPLEIKQFYLNNMDISYSFTIDPHQNLTQQSISQETKAIILNLYINYIATKNQKTKINEILLLREKQEEYEKTKNYNLDIIFKDSQNFIKNSNIYETEKTTNTDLVQYQESIFVKLKKFILKVFHKN